MEHDDTCNSENCDEPLAFDLPSIFIDKQTYCSPDCAITALKDTTNPSRVGLRDPQYDVERDRFPGVDEDDISIHRKVTDLDDARTAVTKLMELYPGAFRASGANE